MNDISALTQIDYAYVFISVFAILVGIKAIISLTEWFINKLGIETKHMKEKREDHNLLLKTSQELSNLQRRHNELVTQDLAHVKAIKNDIYNLSNTVNGIAVTLSDMKEKDNETKLKELKSALVRYYNKYKNLEGWSKLESDAFWDLFNDYESRGGDGYIHSIVEPVMRELKEIN